MGGPETSPEPYNDPYNNRYNYPYNDYGNTMDACNNMMDAEMDYRECNSRNDDAASDARTTPNRRMVLTVSMDATTTERGTWQDAQRGGEGTAEHCVYTVELSLPIADPDVLATMPEATEAAEAAAAATTAVDALEAAEAAAMNSGPLTPLMAVKGATSTEAKLEPSMLRERFMLVAVESHSAEGESGSVAFYTRWRTRASSL